MNPSTLDTRHSTRAAQLKAVATQERCVWCAHRQWMKVYDPDGNLLGPAYRCEIKGSGAVIRGNDLCDIDRFERKSAGGLRL